MHDIDESLLPGILREIAGLIGLPATLKLCDYYGGVRLYVPKHIPAEHILIDLVGREAACILSEHYGGQEHFDIPKAHLLRTALRNSKIMAEYPALSRSQLARKYGLTERHIGEILATARREAERKNNPKQQTLF
ncbi:Mor transcription activator family protein [Nitrosomonas halophila]|uniref:Mor transcription activator family protein n=1 Tax=Nitrosomonas halophila TaxID=44576 RepID=A0A1H3FGD2_9PROT|nr:Mor transcription activator family protein [Nitrosomonas halophila]SDX89194.1 Mor transcription activator family protein [Nitrosomonas halophila]